VTTVKRIAFRAAAVAGALLVCAYAALLVTFNSARFQTWARAELKERTGYDVVAGEVRLDPLLRLKLSAVTAAKGSTPLLQAERMLVVFSPASLFAKTVYRLQLVKPTLHLRLEELLDSTRTSNLDIRIRHLNIEDGTVVLKTGDGDPVDFRSLAMNAENVNLGGAGRINLRADVASLDAVIDIAVTGDEKEKRATIRLDQTRARGSTNAIEENRIAPALEANLKLANRAGEPIQISAGGKLNGMVFAAGRFSGDFELRADLTPDLKEALVAAKAVATELPSRLPFLPVTLPEGNATMALEGKYAPAQKQLAIKSLQVLSPLGTAAATGSIHFTPAIRLTNTRVNLRKVSMENLKPLLPNALKALALGGQIEADLDLDGPWRALDVQGVARGSGIQLKGEGLSVAELDFKTPVAWAGASFRAGAIELRARTLAVSRKNRIDISAGQFRFDGTMDKKPDERVKVAGAVGVSQARFASADGSKLGENLAVSGHVETTAGQNGGAIALAGKLDIASGEVLWGKFFADLKPQRPSIEFDGDYLDDRDGIRVRDAKLSLASVGGVRLKGEIERASESPVMRLEIQSDGLQAAGAFEFFVRETLNRTYPILDRMAVAGRIGLLVKATGALDEPALEGELRLRGGRIGAKANNWELAAIELLLPFRVRYPAAPSNRAAAQTPAGLLTVGSARFGSEAIAAVKAPVSLWNNRLEFHQPIRLPIYGGLFEISELSWQDIVQAPQALSLSIEAQKLQLLKLTEALGWHRLSGTLSGSIPKIEWTGESLRSEGRIEINVFGGRAQIGQLEIENPFSSVPSIKLDARFQDIQLEQASETFAFGRVTGILEGTVGDLVIAAKQPSQFTADLHSVEKPGFSQRISVEALNKITVLSSGNDAGTLYGGLAGFFDNFRYSKLGFRATLKNDKLVLRGVESREGQEYLVVGTFIPPTVNVISHTREIAFSELLRRLERIQKSEAPHTAAQ
jgi:hypothetical protein